MLQHRTQTEENWKTKLHTMNNLQVPFSLLRLEQLQWVDKVQAQYSILPEEVASTSSHVFSA